MKAIPTASDSRAWASIDLSALQANFEKARAYHPDARMVAIVKANAYGHGVIPVATALQARMREGDCFGVACLEEALELRQAGFLQSILLIEGVVDAQQLDIAMSQGCMLVVHTLEQAQLMQAYWHAHPDAPAVTLWLKIDTGMHRLGLSPEEFVALWRQWHGHPRVRELIPMTHFACADDRNSDMTHRQLALLEQTLARAGITPGQQAISAAASSGIQLWPESQYQWLRPGIMLYGGTAVAGENAIDRGIAPVMTLHARVIAIKNVAAGETVGYGASYVCEHERRIGVISIGYGDGYPRRMPTGTPVLLRVRTGGGLQTVRVPLCGRVSMDMCTVDLSACPEAQRGDEVILWGEGLPADEIARCAGTLAYELFCQVTPRVRFLYREVQEPDAAWPK